MKKIIWITTIIAVLIAGVLVYGLYFSGAKQYCWPYCPNMTDADREILKYSDQIVVAYPKVNSKITSPVTILGEARGSWFFEASFPVFIVNWDGLIIGQGIAKAKSDWMTEKFVPFEAVVTYIKPEYKDNGAVILKNDNPSGDPSRDKAVEIPVIFK